MIRIGLLGAGYIAQVMADTVNRMNQNGMHQAVLTAVGELDFGRIFQAPDEERAHDVPGFRGICAEYVAQFEKEFGGTDCAELKPKYFKGGERCAELVNANSELLEEFLRKLKD